MCPLDVNKYSFLFVLFTLLMSIAEIKVPCKALDPPCLFGFNHSTYLPKFCISFPIRCLSYILPSSLPFPSDSPAWTLGRCSLSALSLPLLKMCQLPLSPHAFLCRPLLEKHIFVIWKARYMA